MKLIEEEEKKSGYRMTHEQARKKYEKQLQQQEKLFAQKHVETKKKNNGKFKKSWTNSAARPCVKLKTRKTVNLAFLSKVFVTLLRSKHNYLKNV